MSTSQTVLVTGVSRGIGAQLLSQLLARNDTRVIAAVRSLDTSAGKKLVEQSKSNSNLIVVKIDSESTQDAQEAARIVQGQYSVDRVDLVIANAGIAADFEQVARVKLEHLQQSFNINVAAPISLFQAFEPLLNKSANPRILFISTAIASLAMQRQLLYKSTTYGSSKVALNFVALRIAIEHPNITAVTLHPGLVATDMAAVAQASINQDITKSVESGDAITPEQSASAILKLADEAKNETHSGKFFHAPAGTELPW